MKPTRIFLDLDDVLNRFTMPALFHVGCLVDPFIYDDYKPEWGWNIVSAANFLHPRRTFTTREFWESLGYDFWAYLPKSDICDDLIDMAGKLVGKENVCILSSPTLEPQVAAAKVWWIQKSLPTWLHRQYLIGPRKWFCASRGAVLIDDNDENVGGFRCCGGMALTVPRPWNKLHALDTWLHVSECLAAWSDKGAE